MILVTGAGGTVGTHLVERLRADGHAFRAAYRSADKAARATSNGVNAVKLDFAAPVTLAPALDGIDTVFLLGAGVHGQIEGEINVVHAATAAGVTRLIKQSVWAAAGEPYALARMHRTIERAVEASGLAWTFLRPNGFMQNFAQDMADTIKAQAAIYQPAADVAISHIDARDVAAVAAQALTSPGHEGKAYELSGPQGLTYADAAEVLSRVLGRTIAYVPVTDDAARSGMMAAGLPDFYADIILDLFRAYRTGMASRVTSDVERVTGHAPIAFEQFARDHEEAFR